MSLQRRLIVDMLQDVRELAGGAFQHLPSSEASFRVAETRGRHRALLPVRRRRRARDRVKLLKLIWDFIGTEYGGRQLQYEMFYSAAQPVVNRRMFRVLRLGARPGRWSTGASASTDVGAGRAANLDSASCALTRVQRP